MPGGSPPVNAPSDQPSPIGLALEWVSRIFAVVMVMVLLGLFGQWLDGQFGTGFLVLVGFGVGLTAGIWLLLSMTKAKAGSSGRSGPSAEKDRRP